MMNFVDIIKEKLFPNRYSEDYYDENTDEEYEDDYEEEEPVVRSRASSSSSRRYTSSRYGSGTRIYKVNTNVQMEVLVCNPTSIEDAGEACDALKDKKTVVVNLEKVNYETAQRISDFLSGACFALEGNIQLISNEILIIGPMNVDITGEFADELEANGINIPRTSSTKWR